MQSTNALLPGSGFDPEKLIAPRQAIVAFLSRVAVTPPGVESVGLDDAAGRVLARDVDAEDDYPSVPRSAMDGFAIAASATPGRFRIAGGVRMGAAVSTAIDASVALRIPTGGALPGGADAVVPIEEAAVTDELVEIRARIDAGTNVIQAGDDMRRGERILRRGQRIGSPQIGVLAALGVAEVEVYRRPLVGVLSSGDELVDVSQRLRPGEVRDSNRYAVAASLRAMGAAARHYPTLRDETGEFTRGLEAALEPCDAVVVTGGSSVGERDRLPAAVAELGVPGIVVHGLRLRPGKPTLLGAIEKKPIVGLPGNPTSALMVLEAVVSPIVGALTGAPVVVPAVQARLGEAAHSRAGWTWYVPVALEDEAGSSIAYPLRLRSFSVSLTARAGGYIVMDERDECWPANTTVTVYRFLA
jgi:molybdenum cofactor synthesis domain-containing protein